MHHTRIYDGREYGFAVLILNKTYTSHYNELDIRGGIVTQTKLYKMSPPMAVPGAEAT